MPNSQSAAASVTGTEQIVQEAYRGAKESLSSAWSRAGAELERTLDAAIGSGLAAAAARIERHARRDLASALNQAVRRLSGSVGEDLWADALLEATSHFSRRSALFAVEGKEFRLIAARGCPGQLSPQKLPLSAAPALAQAAESNETVIGACTESELSKPVMDLVGAGERFAALPILQSGAASAVLCAEIESAVPDTSGLELIALIAGVMRPAQPGPQRVDGDAGLIHIHLPPDSGAQPEDREPPASPPLAPNVGNSWSLLGKSDQELHLRAQRWARVRVAEIRLYRPAEVEQGRIKRDLYGLLQREIDTGREIFRREYLHASNTMVDYFHLELLRTLAGEDTGKLGPSYPGPML